MKLREFILQREEIIKRLCEGVDRSSVSLKEAEQKILDHVNRIGQIMMDQVVAGVQDPVGENRVMVGEKEAAYGGMRNLRFINRFGGQTVRSRRCYKYVDHKGGYYPLDEKLGVEECGGFSPLMTYLQALFGGCESFERSEELLRSSIGFAVSATAIQRNTEDQEGEIPDQTPHEPQEAGAKPARVCQLGSHRQAYLKRDIQQATRYVNIFGRCSVLQPRVGMSRMGLLTRTGIYPRW